MLSRFFIDRPVFAWVLAIAVVVIGGLAIHNLPISQYPPIAPPTIYITAFYAGASAETVENSVTQIIEQKMTGLEDMIYMSAFSDSSGTARLELTFKPGTDPDIAWTKVQNKLQLAISGLPETVQKRGITVGKATKNYLLIVGLLSEDGSMDGNDLRDYAQSNLEKVLARIEGVGEVENYGTQYAMRIWLNPDKLISYGLTIEDVMAAIKAYNVEVSAGQFGGAPAAPGQRLNASIIVQSLLKTPDEFAAIPIRIQQDGSVVRIRDVGRAELGTEFYDVVAHYNGQPCAALAIRQASGANALNTANCIKAKLEEMSRYFPPGMKVIYPYDTTPFTRVAIQEVVKTLFEAVFLVFIIIYLFMGNFRATFIPTMAIPVVLMGTFAVLWMAGFSINMLTMFAMVLVIGLLVDDAIVVVENVERIMVEDGLGPKEATIRSMEQIVSALIGISLVLSAVFGPMAFFPGSTGVIYRQFAVTVIAAMLLSVLVALILTPVLCAHLLRPVPAGYEPADNAIRILRPFFHTFDRLFFRLRDIYIRLVNYSFLHKPSYIAVYILLVISVNFMLWKMPTAYLPDEDQGILFVMVMLPSNATLEQTKELLEGKVKPYFLNQEKDAVASCLTVAGISFAGRGQNMGLIFVKLKDWNLRNSQNLKVKAVAQRASRYFSSIREAMVFAFPPPSVIELGNATGFDFQLLDRGGLGHVTLMQARNQLLGMAMQDKRLARVWPNGMEDVPEYHIDVDWDRAGAMGVPITSINNVIAASFGAAYVNDFIQVGRVKRVFVQFDAPYRMLPTDLDHIYVRNMFNKMVPISAFASGHWQMGSPKLERFNAVPSLNIWGEPAPGRSSGEAMKAMEELVERLSPGVGFDWTGLSYQERMATRQVPILYAFSILVIFLCVAALYESWTIPFANLFMLPLGLLGATVATWSRGLANDVYFQIGFLTTLGLTTKNAILIIQFAKARIDSGLDVVQATLEAARIRFRPVIMTSLAFFFGVLPLALATGAGSGAMKAIGTAVTGGMLSATFIDLFFIPLFFVMIYGRFHKKQKKT